jgi:thiol:disulfide interchange protein DsbD
MRNALNSLILSFCFILTGCVEGTQLELKGRHNFDLERSLIECNKKVKKLLIYFTSYGCSGCRVMEDNLLNNSNIVKLIKENYNFVTLYTDDRLKIENQNGILNHQGNEIRTNGGLNSYYQIKLTRSGSQPVFAIVENNDFTDKTLHYTKDEIKFSNFLKVNK